jgi:UDP-N-acetylmuramoylalanine--D-glutamate ligase
VDKSDIVVAFGDSELRAPGAGPLAKRGSHFATDAVAAAAAAVFLGADAGAVERGLDGFVPDHHRLEWIGSLGGVRFYDDSMATNPFAAVAAIRASAPNGSSARVVLIAGGRKKVPDLIPLRDEASRVRAVVAIGEAAGDVARAFEGTDVPVERAGSMPDAVRRAAAQALPGDAVLLAPACASQDAYTDYAERGLDFQKACRSLGVGM